MPDDFTVFMFCHQRQFGQKSWILPQAFDQKLLLLIAVISSSKRCFDQRMNVGKIAGLFAANAIIFYANYLF